MSITNRVQCYAFEGFDLYAAINLGKITFSTDRHLVFLDYDVDTMGVSSIVEASLDPTGDPSHGILHYNTNNGKIYFADGDEFHHIGTVLGRDGVNVISRGLISAPDSSTGGDQFIVSGTPDTLWSQHKHHIAYYTGSSWEFSVPEVDQVCGVENEFCDYKFNGYAWVKQYDSEWVSAIAPEGYILVDDGEPIPVEFGQDPGVVSSTLSGTPGVAILVSRSDHSHDLGPHSHSGSTNGGVISHSALSSIGANDHHYQVHSGLDHTGIIGTWAQINLAGSSLADIQSRSHSLLTDIGLNTHSQIDYYLSNHDHNGTNSKEVSAVDGGFF